MSLNRAELLQAAAVAYRNIVEMGLGNALATANYSEERRQQGLLRVTDLQTKLEAQQETKGTQLTLTRQIAVALSAGREDFKGLKQAVRTADRLDSADYYTQLNLKGRTPTSYSGFVALAKTVYANLLAAPEIIAALGTAYTQETITQRAEAITDLETLNSQQEQAKGEYQGFTRQVEALEKAVTADLKTLKAVVRTVYPDPAEQGQILRALQLEKV